jgi:hypothetical protein
MNDDQNQARQGHIHDAYPQLKGLSLAAAQDNVRQVRQPSALEVGGDLFDDGVPPVIGLRSQHRQRRVGEHRAVPPEAGTAHPARL